MWSRYSTHTTVEFLRNSWRYTIINDLFVILVSQITIDGGVGVPAPGLKLRSQERVLRQKCLRQCWESTKALGSLLYYGSPRGPLTQFELLQAHLHPFVMNNHKTMPDPQKKFSVYSLVNSNKNSLTC